MTVSELYQSAYAHALPTAWHPDDCAFDLSCLLEHCFGVGRHALFTAAGQAPADADAHARFLALCARYEKGEPLQYLLGEWEFFGLPFEVGPGVLIPRPDTETLVETGLRLCDSIATPWIADLCAGSGCVSIALASRLPQAQIYAVERSKRAVSYLARNITRNQTKNVHAIAGDVLTPPHFSPLDLIVSNPPYIPAGELASLSPQVRREPEVALNGGVDGLDFYRVLIPLYRPLLREGGAFAFEVGHTQAETVAALFARHRYERVGIDRDLAGVARVVYAFRPD